jgi:DNA-binding CsgD family transcriptional regulator
MKKPLNPGLPAPVVEPDPFLETLPSFWRIPPNYETEHEKVVIALRERIKELNCLYGISQLADRHPESLEDLFQELVNLLPPSWQYPEIACARIIFRGKTFKTRDFKVTKWRQTAPIIFYNQRGGEVTVFYREERPAAHEGPFLREERALLEAVAQRISHIAMRLSGEQELQETNRQLTVERKALQESNAALRAVLARIEEEKQEIYRNVQANVEKVLMPILHALMGELPKLQRKYVEMLKTQLEEMTSPFTRHLSRQYHALTPSEIKICNMIRSGLRTKEIADLQKVSVATVNRHREHIRRKLKITNNDVNLATYLQSSMWMPEG